MPRVFPPPLSSRKSSIQNLKSHEPFLLVLGLSAFFHLAALVALRPGGYLTTVTDLDYYYAFARLSNLGLYPFVDFWLEYPPIFPWLVLAAYKLSLFLPAHADSSFVWFRWLLGGVLLVPHLGALVLVYAIGLQLHGLPTAWRVAALYASLFIPLLIWMVWFEPLPLFFLLLSIYLALRGRTASAGLAAGFGFMTKVVPILALAPALASARDWRARVLCLAAAATAVAIVSLPLLSHLHLLGASFLSMLARSPWESPWAVLDGYFEFGRVAPLEDRFFTESSRWTTYPPGLGSRLALPALLVFGGLYLALWWRVRRPPQPRQLVALAGLAVLGFLLLGKGYSPQFLAYALPFVVLVAPDRYGLSYALGLSAVNLLEWPLYHELLPHQPVLMAGLVVARSALLLAVAGDHLRLLFDWPRWEIIRRRLCTLLLAGLAGAALLGGILGWPAWLEQRARLDPYAGPIQFVRQHGPERAALIFTDDVLYHHFYPYTWQRGELAVLRPRIAGRQLLFSPRLSENARRERLQSLLDQNGAVWLIAFQDDDLSPQLRRWLRERAERREHATYDNGWQYSPETRSVTVELWVAQPPERTAE